MAWSALDHMVIRSFLFSVSIAHSLALGRALKRSWARMPSYPFLPFLLVELYMIKFASFEGRRNWRRLKFCSQTGSFAAWRVCVAPVRRVPMTSWR